MTSTPALTAEINAILAPACRALYGLGPELLATALSCSDRLRSSYPRTAARAMWTARRNGDVDAARRAADLALSIASGNLPVGVSL